MNNTISVDTWQTWFQNQVAIYKPVIDTTVTAFSVDSDAIKIYFYFQNSNIDIKTDKVVASLTNKGKSIFQSGDYSFFEVIQENPIYTTNLNKIMYCISIQKELLRVNEFKELLGSQLLLKIAGLRNKIKETTNGNANIEVDYKTYSADYLVNTYGKSNLVMTEFSEAMPIYVILSPNFKVYGGLSAQDIIDNSAFPKLKSSGASNEQDYILYDPGNRENFFYPETPDSYRIKGVLTFDKSQDSIYEEDDYISWYQLQFYTNESINNSTLIEDSDRLYTDRNWDYYYRSFAYTFETDFTTELNKDVSSVLLLIIYKTAKGYFGIKEFSLKVETGIRDTFVKDEDIWFKENSLNIQPDILKGTVTLEGIMQSNKAKSILGYLVYQRADLRKSSLSWETIAKEDFEIRYGGEGKESNFSFVDKTADFGVPYRYRVQFYYKAKVNETDLNNNEWITKYANNILEYSDSSKVFFLLSDDSFLMTKDEILKIGYNPQITNLKRNIVDVVTPTLGGSYPFVRRNGSQKYHTFNIGGLISCAQENGDLPVQEVDELATPSFSQDWFNTYDNNFGLSLYQKQKTYEKLYRQKILDFLYKDQVVLFKSFQEGNMLVKLSNIQLTPVQNTDRVLYSFTAQATEIAEPTAANYQKYFSNITEDIELSIVRYYIFGEWDSQKTFLSSQQFIVIPETWYGAGAEGDPDINITPSTTKLSLFQNLSIKDYNYKIPTYANNSDSSKVFLDIVEEDTSVDEEEVYNNPLALLGEKKIYRLNQGGDIL